MMRNRCHQERKRNTGYGEMSGVGWDGLFWYDSRTSGGRVPQGTVDALRLASSSVSRASDERRVSQTHYPADFQPQYRKDRISVLKISEVFPQSSNIILER